MFHIKGLLAVMAEHLGGHVKHEDEVVVRRVEQK